MALSREDLIKEIGGMTVLELSELVKSLEEEFGVSAAMPVAAAPAQADAGQGQAEEEKSEYKVELTEGGSEKIKTIKALRQVTSLGLTDAKKAVEQAPTVIAESASKEDAQKMKETLEAAGAKVKLS
jgi:large subunit ribosomal protein L7/L12